MKMKRITPELRTALRLDEGDGDNRPSQTDLIDGLYKQREELQKRIIDLEEQYLARDVKIIADLGLQWPPDTTFAEVLKTAWDIREFKPLRDGLWKSWPLGTLIYLASPYSHEESHIQQYRVDVTMEAVMSLLLDGHFVYSPILHNHGIVERCGIPGGWGQWERFDTLMIDRSDEVWVLAIDGWLESKGVQAEIEIARKQGKPVRLVQQTPNGWEVGPQIWQVGVAKQEGK